MKRVLSLILLLAAPSLLQAQALTENVFLITYDGLRWQELFTGADAALIEDERYVDDVDGLKTRFWAEDAETRREKLLPFFWNVIAQGGQLYGNRTAGCEVNTVNTHRFSYPGYNEILAGFSDDDRIDSNDKVPNPTVTVLEFVNHQSDFAGQVAAFASWDVFPYIINEARSGVPVNAGFEHATGPNLSDRERFLNELQPQVPSPWGTVRLDAFTHHYAKEYLEKHQPRLLYVAYGETDDFAHDGEYDAYLKSAYQTDAFIRDLWEWAQSHEAYRGKTTLLITTDHGRGFQDEWTGHGNDIDGAEAIWIAALGPDTPMRGIVEGTCGFTQSQIAATTAALLGLNYTNDRPVGAVLDSILGR